MSVFVNGCKDTEEADRDRGGECECDTLPVSLTSWADSDTELPFPTLAA